MLVTFSIITTFEWTHQEEHNQNSEIITKEKCVIITKGQSLSLAGEFKGLPNRRFNFIKDRNVILLAIVCTRSSYTDSVIKTVQVSPCLETTGL